MTNTTPIAELRAALAETLDALEYFIPSPQCRDCADENGTCPNSYSGVRPCDPDFGKEWARSVRDNAAQALALVDEQGEACDFCDGSGEAAGLDGMEACHKCQPSTPQPVSGELRESDNSVDFHQRRGRDADIIQQALEAYRTHMLDDSFGMDPIHRIFELMEKRFNMVDRPALLSPDSGWRPISTVPDKLKRNYHPLILWHPKMVEWHGVPFIVGYWCYKTNQWDSTEHDIDDMQPLKWHPIEPPLPTPPAEGGSGDG